MVFCHNPPSMLRYLHRSFPNSDQRRKRQELKKHYNPWDTLQSHSDFQPKAYQNYYIPFDKWARNCFPNFALGQKNLQCIRNTPDVFAAAPSCNQPFPWWGGKHPSIWLHSIKEPLCCGSLHFRTTKFIVWDLLSNWNLLSFLPETLFLKM